MPNVCRVGDRFGAYSITSGSPNVKVNGIAVGKIGNSVSDGGVITSGSSTVKVNGVGICRIGDVDSKGHTATSGSGNVTSV